MVERATDAKLADIFSIGRKLAGREFAGATVRTCRDAFAICAVDRATPRHAAALAGSVSEDSVQIAYASIAGLDAIVTRDPEGFVLLSVLVLSPAEFLAGLR